MPTDYLLGTDIGTHGTTTVVVTPDGTIEGSAGAEYEIDQPEPSWAEQWPDVWVEATYSTIRDAIDDTNANPGDVRGISISSLYGGTGVPVDDRGDPVAPSLIWMDRRSTEQVQWVKDNVDLDELFDITGNYVDSYFGYTKILWLRDNEPRTWEDIEQFVPPNNYVQYRMTGELVVDYSSAGCLGGVFDIDDLEWSEDACEQLGIPIDKLPARLVPCESVVGHVTDDAAGVCGLDAGTPVLAGGIDAPMATLAAGAYGGGHNVSMMGTSTCWGTIHSGENLSKQFVSMPHVADSSEQIYTFGGSATGGALIEWFTNEFCQAEQQAGELVDLEAFDLLNTKAEEIPPGSEGLVALPYFKGERSPIWDADARGNVLGLTLYHEKAHVYRALMEATAYSLQHNIEIADEIGLPLEPETSLVGGVSNSELWTQILADVTGREMVVPAGGVGAPLGDAFLAGVGTDLFDGYDAITDWIGRDRVHAPDPAAHETYSDYYEIYTGLYRKLKNDMHDLARLA